MFIPPIKENSSVEIAKAILKNTAPKIVVPSISFSKTDAAQVITTLINETSLKKVRVPKAESQIVNIWI